MLQWWTLRHARGKQVSGGMLPLIVFCHCVNNYKMINFSFTVKDYQLIQPQDSSAAGLPGQPEGQGSPKALLSRYLSNFTSIISHLLQTSQDNNSPDAVEASWVLSLALKGLYNTLKVTETACETASILKHELL